MKHPKCLPRRLARMSYRQAWIQSLKEALTMTDEAVAQALETECRPDVQRYCQYEAERLGVTPGEIIRSQALEILSDPAHLRRFLRDSEE